MTSSRLLPSFRRQQLVFEFAALKHCCPDGIYLSLNPNDPASWNGVLFVREGPYSSAVLRFEILFPLSYPQSLPFVSFNSEIFHPLLVPLTTYSFSGGADPSSTYSASDTDRLPPGAFNLKHGFPNWAVARERGRAPSWERQDKRDGTEIGVTMTPTGVSGQDTQKRFDRSSQTEKMLVVQVLEYVSSAFEDPTVLDALPLEAAANPSAWHAWRSYRNLSDNALRSTSPASTPPKKSTGFSRNPADWNWDGLWEARVRNGIDDSISDATLFSSKNSRNSIGASGPIRFLHLDDQKLEAIQSDIMRAHGVGLESAADGK